jgi:hypothetical protein
MSDEKALVEIHPEGELPAVGIQPSETVASVVTFAGKIQVKWVSDVRGSDQQSP